jgi:hypothetical protein
MCNFQFYGFILSVFAFFAQDFSFRELDLETWRDKC